MNNENMKLSPIALFVYNRLWHTQQTVDALQRNELASESELFIYSDYAKNDEALSQVKEVREYIKTIDGFKKITIIERDKNWGIDNSIIDGVTKIVSEYDKIIVIEDDLVTSPYFLKFMNEALEFYKEKEEIWHISGWNYPIETKDIEDVFFFRVMNCWGWGTWADRWQYFEQNIRISIDEFSRSDIKRFRLDTGDFWKQVKRVLRGDDNNWDIKWYATIFKQKGLCLISTQSFVKNIGLDGSGSHCGKTNIFTSKMSLNENIKYNTKIKESSIALERIKLFYKSQKKPTIIRIINKLARIVIKRNLIE